MKLTSTKSIFSRTTQGNHFCFQYIFVEGTKEITKTCHIFSGYGTVICSLTPKYTRGFFNYRS